jgi:hypothetical protein
VAVATGIAPSELLDLDLEVWDRMLDRISDKRIRHGR